MIEKRVLAAALISVLFLSLYSRILAKRYPALNRPQTQTAAKNLAPPAPSAHENSNPVRLLEHEETVTIESKPLLLEIGKQTGGIHSVLLRRFKDTVNGGAVRFGHNFPLFNLTPEDEPATVSGVTTQGREASIDFITKSGTTYRLLYQLAEENPVVTVNIQSLDPSKPVPSSFTLLASWMRGDNLSNNQNRLESFTAAQEIKEKRKYSHTVVPLRKEKNVPRGTFLVSLSERYFLQAIRLSTATTEGVILPSHEGSLVARLTIQKPEAEKPIASIYLGPRDYFQMKKAEFAEALPIGILGQIGLMLLLILGWLASITHNYGVSIILFSILITCVMAPFTLIGFRSMKKMQALRPKIDKIMADNKNNPTKANQEVLALYREHKISPFGGCLPMLLQMPIFIALFQAISHFIDLRGQNFLWIKDLSLPDRIVHLSFQFPILGDYINALPAVMALAMYLQTRASQGMAGSAKNDPTTQMMSGPMMPILFFFMFYHFPSGLVLYWLTNSLCSMAWYRLAK